MNNTKSLLEYITLSATANSEEDQAFLMTLLSPSSDRTEMGMIYNNLLGYNPVSYFDEQDLSRIYDGILDSEKFKKASVKVKEFLANDKNKNTIIERTLSLLEDDREDYLVDLLIDTIKDETDWSYDPYEGDDVESFDVDECECEDDISEEEDDSEDDDDEEDGD